MYLSKTNDIRLLQDLLATLLEKCQELSHPSFAASHDERADYRLHS